MSHGKVAPEGLKSQECERNVGKSKSPIPYIPQKDVIQEAIDSSANMLKLALPHKVESQVPVGLKGHLSKYWCTSSKPLMPSGRKAS